jgi:NAD(P)-dependent dehydrogenase (short-subunit alcohol dehydrogenase family)
VAATRGARAKRQFLLPNPQIVRDRAAPRSQISRMTRYATKTALVIGGTHGMGRATVEALLDGGARMLLTGNNVDTVEAARQALRGRAQVVRPDVANPAAIEALGAQVASELAAELAPRGVRVNAVSPGFIDTPTMGVSGASRAELDAFADEGRHTTPMGRIGSADEVAPAVLFLAFEATFTTGAELPVDGGLGQL